MSTKLETKTIGGYEITEIKYLWGDESELQYGLLIHDVKDKYHDGDGIVEWSDLSNFETEDDVTEYCKNSYYETCFEYDKETGIYKLG